jgi:hypothetical protein
MESNADNTTGRAEAVLQLYKQTFRTILSTISEDRDLLTLQAYDIVTGLSQHLDQYKGELDDAPFLLWALSTLHPASRVVILMVKHRKLIYKAFWDILHSCEDLIEPNTFDELDSDMVCWLMENGDPFNPDDKRKPSTIVYERAYWTARTWKTLRLRNRAKTADPTELIKDYERCLDIRALGKIPYEVHRDTPSEPFGDEENEEK